MAVKVSLVKINPWPKTDRPWSSLHINYVGSMNRIYYLIVVNSFTKWPKNVGNLHAKAQTFCTKFSQDLVFQIQLYLIMKPNLRLKNLEISTKIFSVIHVSTAPFHPRSNSQEECVVDTFKQSLRKADGVENEVELLQHFSQSVLNNNKSKYNFRIVTSWAYVHLEDKIGIW